MLAVPPVNRKTFASKGSAIACRMVTFWAGWPGMLTFKLPSTVVQPRTLNFTRNAPPAPLRSSGWVVIEPTAEDVPSLATPPAL